MAASSDRYAHVLSEKELEKAKDELNEIAKETQSHIETLRTWVTSHPQLSCRTDDEFLLRFLRVGKFSQLRSRDMITNLCTVRSSVKKGAPDWFKDLDPNDPNMLEFLDLGWWLPLPDANDNGEVVCLIQTGLYDPAKYDIDKAMRSVLLNYEILMMDERVQVNGCVYLLDFGLFSASHGMQFGPYVLQKASRCWYDTYPARIKASHYLRTPIVFNAFYEVAKLFMREKLLSRVRFHKDSLDSLHEYVPKRILPEEYGGTAGTLKELAGAWKKRVLDNADEVTRNQVCRVSEESLNTSIKHLTVSESSDNGGMVRSGSFRKLDT